MPVPRSRLLLALTIAVTACGGSDDYEAKEVPMSRIEASWPSKDIRKSYVVRMESQWQAAWAEHEPWALPAEVRPTLDFERVMVVGLTLGSGPNGCHGMSIRRVVDERHEIRVEYRHAEPPGNSLAICTDSIVPLTDFVAIPRTDKAVYFARTPD